MVNKKKVSPPPKKLALKAPDSVKGGGEVEERRDECVYKEFESSAYNDIKVECERALTAVRRGNYNKAVRLLKESSQKFKNSALIHRVQATVFVKAAAVVDDPTVKQRHFRNALEAARRAVELSPNSIEFAFYHANLLCEVSNDPAEFEQVTRECEKALGMEDPIDPAKESLLDASQQKISTAEGRIANIRDELRALIQRANIKSISNWVKAFGHIDDKITIVPVSRTVEDPMEAMLLENRKPNEIRKANKTSEERRKEVEVRVAAARLLQQKPDSPPAIDEGDGQKTRAHFSSENTNRSGDVRKSRGDRKNVSLSERRDRVRPYWNSMSMGDKRGLFQVGVADMKTYFGSLKDRSTREVLNEALAFAKGNNTWKFWICCRCSEKFADPGAHNQHVVREHMRSLLPRFQSVMPSIVDDEWVNMILSSSWKPLDLNHAVDVDKDQPKCQLIKMADDEYGDSWHKECIKESVDSPSETDALGNQLSLTDEFYECRSNQVVRFVDRWPVSDDPERAELLDRIHFLFQRLIQHRYLSSSHLIKVIQFTVDELQGSASGSQLLKFGVDQSPTCICFLSAPKLRNILKFLQDVAQSCGLPSYPEKSTNASESLVDGGNSLDDLESVVLSEDASFLLLSERIASINAADQMSENRLISEKGTLNASTDTSKCGNLTDCDSVLSWIYSVPQTDEHIASWNRAKEKKLHRGLDILKILDKEFCHLQDLCEKKCDHLGYEEALQLVEDLCLHEGKKKEFGMDSATKGYETLLKERKDELFRQEHDAIFTTNRFELDVISSVLRDAESMSVNQMGYDGSYCDAPSYLRDLEYCEEENWRSNGYLRQMDSCIEIVIQRQKEQLSIELSKFDAKIMRIVSEMHQIELKLEYASSHDFRAILLPLVKSFLQVHLEDQAEKYATKKSDAIRESLLAELALDQKRLLEGKNAIQEKIKEKKKSKDFRKTKTKPSEGKRIVDNLSAEESSFISTIDDNPASPNTSIIMSNVSLKDLEEPSRNHDELEAEERKLQETLDYQRRVEYDAKQKHLAKLFKETTTSSPEKLEGLVSQGNGFLDKDSGFCTASMDKTAGIDARTVSGSNKEISIHSYHYVDSKGRLLKDGGVGSDLKTRNKTYTQTRSKDIDGKHENVSSEKKNVKTGKIDRGMKHEDSNHTFSTNAVNQNGGNRARTLQTVQAEDESEKLYQAYRVKAVQKSREITETHQEFPFGTRIPSRALTVNVSPKVATSESQSEIGMMGTGLKNEVGEYNCFLNVIIQSLWHITLFQKELLRSSTSKHIHVGDHCVVCALHGIFTSLSLASRDHQGEAVAPTELRLALSNLYPNSNFFQEGQMNDASEVLGVIFECLHRSSTSNDEYPDAKLVKNSCLGCWDCSNKSCIAHFLFGMDIFESMKCCNCHLESRHLKYTSFFHNVNASSLRKIKAANPDSSFGELLNLVEMEHQLACDSEIGGCGMLNYIHHTLSSPPHVFITVLGWQKTRESSEDIIATLAALNMEINLSVLYHGVDPDYKCRLVSMVCYYGQHYHCFAYSSGYCRWLLFDDKTVKVIGVWDDVLKMCERGRLQPQLFFFESLN